ncbi:hypothetical protein [Escherichia coli]|uniref:hypothetical protein n=1 Tax=Escherichia coli TaxID=562 RepID=UPI002DB97AC5|nr:hypothetical protein [Escherichia coli]MEC3734215.1 hypothetical protein [Escherichia coli]
MSFFSTIGSFISKAAGFIGNIVKKGAELFSKVDLSSSYDTIEKTFDLYQGAQENKRRYAYSSQLDIGSDSFFVSKQNELSEKVSMHGSEIESIKEKLQDWSDIMGLRIDLSRLMNSALMIERASSNAQLHSSNLNVHYQSIRKISGLMADVNNILYGLKKIIGTLNHNMNKLNSNGSVDLEKIEGIDIDIKQGSISQIAALDAFDATRELLLKEIKTIQVLSQEHIGEVNGFRKKVASYGGNFAARVIQVLDENITPRLHSASELALLLESDLRQLPAPKRNENGRFVTKRGGAGIEIEFDSYGYEPSKPQSENPYDV